MLERYEEVPAGPGVKPVTMLWEELVLEEEAVVSDLPPVEGKLSVTAVATVEVDDSFVS